MIASKLLDDLPLRMQRFPMLVMQFNITVNMSQGKYATLQMHCLKALGCLLPRKRVT